MTELSDYGLALDDTVRWQHKPRGNWHISHVRGINTDGSVTIATDRGMRALPARRLEVQTIAPDGSATWSRSRVEYRDVEGWPGYRVGSDGTVWSRWTRGTHATLGPTWLKLRPTKAYSRYDKLIYLGVNLYKDGKTHKFTVHALVLTAFVGPRPDNLECCHEDGDPANNDLANLRWDTRQSNADDRSRHGTVQRGDGHSNASLTANSVDQIRSLYAAGHTQEQLAIQFGVTRGAISKVLTRRTWKHVP